MLLIYLPSQLKLLSVMQTKAASRPFCLAARMYMSMYMSGETKMQDPGMQKVKYLPTSYVTLHGASCMKHFRSICQEYLGTHKVAHNIGMLGSDLTGCKLCIRSNC